jgi:hypothetical protein
MLLQRSSGECRLNVFVLPIGAFIYLVRSPRCRSLRRPQGTLAQGSPHSG